MDDSLSENERGLLLKLARQALESAVSGREADAIDLASLPARLLEPGTTFITLTIRGELRGCIGGLEPYMPLVEDVRQHAVAAALDDYRFPPVSPAELPELRVEISRLTPACPLEYNTPEDLLQKLRPGIDGVVIRDGMRRATFLPQVWEKLPEAELFLSHLCQKMGARADLWRHKKLDIQVYQVEEFHE